LKKGQLVLFYDLVPLIFAQKSDFCVGLWRYRRYLWPRIGILYYKARTNDVDPAMFPTQNLTILLPLALGNGSRSSLDFGFSPNEFNVGLKPNNRLQTGRRCLKATAMKKSVIN
jgi:hypothetical protein